MNPFILAAVLGALASGALVALQAPTNAMLARAAGSPVNAATISFAVGFGALIVATLLLGTRPNGEAVRGLPWYAWTGGLYGALFVAMAAFATPRLGISYFVVVAIAGQLVVALFLDRIGAFGMAVREISFTRLAGVALVLAGAFLVQQR
jgi:transporter family-2 protein